MNEQDKKTVFWKRRKTILLLWLIFLLGIDIRIYNLGSHNLWFDEGATVAYSNVPYNLMFRDFFAHSHYLYYILLKFWVISFGISEFALRSLSMTFGVLSILLIYRLGKLLFNEKVGLVSAFILSISPIHIWYSQEARGYSLSTFLTLLTVYFFFALLKNHKFYLWVGFIVSFILSIYTNYFCFYIIIAISTLLFLRRYRYLLKWGLVSLFLILVIFLPQIPHFIGQIIKIERNFWVPKLHLNSIAITFENFNVGYNATSNIYFFTFMVFSLLFILGIQRWWQEKREKLIYLISFLFISIISTFLISQKIPIYLDRQLMLFSPFYYIVLAAGLTKIKLRIIKAAAYLSIILPTLFCLHNYFCYRMPLPEYHHIGVHVKKPVKPAADYINKKFIKGDVVGFSEPSSVTLLYYMPKLISEKIDTFAFVIKSKLDIYWRRCGEERGYGIYVRAHLPSFRHAVILDEERSCKSFEEYNFKRLWLISSSWEKNGILDPHAQAIKQWMQVHYFLLDSKEFDGIYVDLYTKKIR